jgi:hypothetical protein
MDESGRLETKLDGLRDLVEAKFDALDHRLTTTEDTFNSKLRHHEANDQQSFANIVSLLEKKVSLDQFQPVKMTIYGLWATVGVGLMGTFGGLLFVAIKTGAVK